MRMSIEPIEASSIASGTPALRAEGLIKRFMRKGQPSVTALDGVSLSAHHGELTALVGPDGAGKTTLLRLASGLLPRDGGKLEVLGIDVGADPQRVQDQISYMPQRFGLYEDLSVIENLDLYADLHGVTAEQRAERYPTLFEMTALGPFRRRLAGRLSGGMKQKLGLACTLVRQPELLLLDEPTVGVDPLSRRELWEIMRHLVRDQGLTVLMSTSYLDEAERCNRAIILQQGRVLNEGPPQAVAQLAAGRCCILTPADGSSPRRLQAQLIDRDDIIDAVPDGGRVRIVRAEQPSAPLDDAQPATPRFEDGFMVLLRRNAQTERAQAIDMAHRVGTTREQPAVQVQSLVKRFGAFVAVDHISFEVQRGEIFGLLGPNGAGKTTTFRMLCGLLPPSGGQLRVAGADVRTAPASARARLGYVAQKFSLYAPLTVLENLEFFAGAYGLRGERRRERIDWALRQFDLLESASSVSGQLPGGYKQRLAMAAALLHEPEILFLDEPTSGADALARRAFWRRISALADQGVTVIVTTHFMQEAEYCDHVAIMDGGQVLAQGSPGEIRARARADALPEPTMEDAFIAVVERARRVSDRREGGSGMRQRTDARGGPEAPTGSDSRSAKLRRVRALVWKETRQIVRDPSSIAMGVILPLILILLFGFGLSLDVKDVPLAVVTEQPSSEATSLFATLQLSPYFHPRLLHATPLAERQLMSGQVDGILVIPNDFATRVAGGKAQLQLVLRGSDANSARIIEGYVEGAVGVWATQLGELGQARLSNTTAGPVQVQTRLWFNEANDSRYFLVPGLVVLVMTLIGALLTAMVMAREWERGTLEALLVTPVRSDEILLGKTLPYFILALMGFGLCALSAEFLFHVPLRGSLWVLFGASMLYTLVALGIGLLISSAVKSQLVASQLTMLATFMPAFMLSGFLFDLRSMPAAVRFVTYLLPARYYVALLQSVFLAGDVWSVIIPNTLVLALMAALLALGSRAVMRKTLA